MNKKWWHDKIAYQIYPKSFYDTNKDGIGDLKGIISKLDYLKDLGIDIIWLSPIYQSPFIDQGYDISDYYKIDESFGTMEDFDILLAEAKKRNMYILMDLVINHCSDKHEWFQKALKDPDGEYGDYFYFRKGTKGNPPSNYRSYFGGSAWEQVEGTDYYYLHMFAKEQPDLNWENPKLLNELYTMINWWLEKGVAGFRIDAIINIKKDITFQNLEPDGPDGLASVWRMVESVDGVGALLEDLKKNTFEKYQAFTVAEVFNMKKDELAEFIGENGHFSTMFDFSAHSLSMGEHGWYDSQPIKFEDFKKALFHSQQECQDVGFLANIIENHDEPRGVNRYLPDYAQNPSGTKMLGTISILLRGIPFLYQGQEIGMQNCPMDSIDDYDDISTRNEYLVALEAGLTREEALKVCCLNSRDNARTPMQWDSCSNAGFTSHTPWLKVNPNYKDINVKDQLAKEDSILSYYKKLLALRKSPEYRELFTYGKFVPLFEEDSDIFAYERTLDGKTVTVLANFGRQERTLSLKERSKPAILLNNQAQAAIQDGQITLNSCQVIVISQAIPAPPLNM
ncbi:MAG: alpha-glucosidase [Lachnospiraceae bacterium]|nr:alpha-glucosidase [Lachnospiraceae bacterium]